MINWVVLYDTTTPKTSLRKFLEEGTSTSSSCHQTPPAFSLEVTVLVVVKAVVAVPHQVLQWQVCHRCRILPSTCLPLQWQCPPSQSWSSQSLVHPFQRQKPQQQPEITAISSNGIYQLQDYHHHHHHHLHCRPLAIHPLNTHPHPRPYPHPYIASIHTQRNDHLLPGAAPCWTSVNYWQFAAGSKLVAIFILNTAH